MVTKLIPQSKLFGNPSKADPKLSPDGKRFAYLANSDKGVLNVFVQNIGEESAKQVTNDTNRGIRSYQWAKNNTHILYKQDVGGDENWHIWGVDLDNSIVRDLTPFQGVRADALFLNKNHPQTILAGLNIRDKKVFDIYSIDLQTGACVLNTTNPGDVSSWIVDADFAIRGAIANDQSDGSKVLRVRDSPTSDWRPICTCPHDDIFHPHTFTPDGTGIFAESTLAHGAGSPATDTARLLVISAATGDEVREVAKDAKCDVDSVVFNEDAHTVDAVVFDYEKAVWVVVDKAVEEDVAALRKLCRGNMDIVSRSADDQTWIVADTPDDGSPRFYLYTRAGRAGTLLFLARPELEEYPLCPMHTHTITAADGQTLVVYVTLPRGADGAVPAADAPPPAPLPTVLVVHGGPWARDRWGWNPQAQWLANRGYACVMVNFRASTGYGKRFLHLGDAQWGATMQQDLTDTVAWAVGRGLADPARVAIFGGSYGGYATLAGLAFTPTLYACGVDIVGPSHLRTLLRSVPAYWAPMRKMLLLRVGDVESDDELNRRASPFYHPEKITRPLLIAQGANDPRVVKAESDQMVTAMRARGTAVEYVLYTDEGHGFARPANRIDFYARAEAFLAKHCGGRLAEAEPDQIKGNCAVVLDGDLNAAA